jgi:hypothetical protein
MFVLNFFAAATLPTSVIAAIVLASMDHSGGLLSFCMVLGTIGVNIFTWGLNALKQEDEMAEEIRKFRVAEWKTALLYMWKQSQEIWAWMAQEVERDNRAMARYHVRKFWEAVEAAYCLQQYQSELAGE